MGPAEQGYRCPIGHSLHKCYKQPYEIKRLFATIRASKNDTHRRTGMYQRDWLDELNWAAILAGVVLALALQVVLTFALLRPLNLSLGWPAVVIVEWCVAA